MINIFKKHRKRMSDDNKPLKYGKYAFGEIVLVVIGILIALQINNWNEHRKNRIFEQEFLAGLGEALQNDFARNKNSQKINNHALLSMKIILDHLENDKPYHDSLDAHFGRSIDFDFWDLSEMVFESVNSKGLDIISNKNLRDSLALAYGSLNRSINYAGFRYHDYIDHAVLNIFNSRFNEAWQGAPINTKLIYMHPLNYEALKEDHEYLYFMRTLPNMQYYKLVIPLTKTQHLLERLLKLIDQDLK